MKAIPVTLIIDAALITDWETAGKITAVAESNTFAANSNDVSRDSDSQAGMSTELGYEANGDMIVHKNTSFQGRLYRDILSKATRCEGGGEMDVKYPVLTGMIAQRAVTKSKIAEAAGMSEKAFYNKMSGRTSFTWEEVCTIQSQFFPDIEKDELFRKG